MELKASSEANEGPKSSASDGENESLRNEANPRTLPLIKQTPITLSQALSSEQDMLLRLSLPPKRFTYFVGIQTHRQELASLMSRDLGLHSNQLSELSHPREWLHGSFNVCIPVYISNWKNKRVMLRLPLPYKTGEDKFPGNTEEKIRTEVATFIWMERNCKDVPIPKLWAFGVGRRRFVRPENAPLVARAWWWRRRWWHAFDENRPCHEFVPVEGSDLLEHGYLLMDYLEARDGIMLSESWEEGRKDPTRRNNLFHSLSRIILSVSRLTLPRIGSWTIDNLGRLSLTNRPLFHHFHGLENAGVPTHIPRTRTYTTTTALYTDLLQIHDDRIIHQPNSIQDEQDGQAQLAYLFAMRGLIRTFTHRSRDEGPFAMYLTDLHPSNIFVDENWNITSIIDLEWACSLPLETHLFSHWITPLDLDQIYQELEMRELDEARREFMAAFEKEEIKMLRSSADEVTPVTAERTNQMNLTWETGTFWFIHVLLSTVGCYNFFRQNLAPMFVGVDVRIEDMWPFWSWDAEEVIQRKLVDKQTYEELLRELFAREDEDDKT